MAAKQTWDSDSYQQNARFVSELGTPVVALLEPKPGERVLDLGCGDGALTETLAAAGCRVVGIDGSADFVRAARARGLDVRLGDGQALDFDADFDAVFSNAALHWMKAPDRVIEGVWRALVPGGRFVAELGAEGNVGTIHRALRDSLAARGTDPDAVDPWYFPSEADYRARLEARGFRVETMTRFSRPTPLPGDVRAWLETFGRAFVDALPESERDTYVDDVRARVAPALRQPDGRWVADYFRLRFAAVRPS